LARAVRHLRIIADALTQADELAALYRAAGLILQADTVEALAERITQAVVAELGMTACGLWQVDVKDRRLRLIARAGPYPEVYQTLDLDGPGLIALAARSNESIYAPDVSVHPHYLPGWKEAASELVIPLATGTTTMALLDLQERRRDAFSARDRRILSTFAERAALSLETRLLAELMASLSRRLQQELEERKQAEEALRQSEERYRQLVELSPDGIVIHQDGRFVFANQAAVRILGAAHPQELLGKPIMDVIHPDYRDVVRERVRQEIEGGKPAHPLEEKFIRLDGTVVDVEVMGTPFIYQGRPAAQVIIRDITERKRAEEALRASEASYRTLFDNVLNGVYRSTPDGRLLAANPALVRMLGYDSEEELLKINVRDLYVDPGQRSMWLQRMDLQGTLRDAELILRRKDGQQIIVLDNARAVRNEQGEVAYYEGILTDITERKRGEEMLARSRYELAILNELSRALSSTLEMETILTTALQQTMDIAAMPVGIISLYDRRTGRLDPQVWRQAPDELLQRLRSPLQSLPLHHQALSLGRSMHSEDLWSDPRITEDLRLLDRHCGLRSLIIVPLLAHREPLGTIGLWDRTTRPMADPDLALLTSMGHQIALALDNALLFRQVETLAITDSLTGVYNRRYLDQTLPAEIGRASLQGYPLGLFMCDIDHFKQWNDTYGHLLGDQVLALIAQTIRATIRDTDWVARYGGEEFVAVLPGCRPGILPRVAEKVRRAINDISLVAITGGTVPSPTVSIGIASYPDHGETAIALLQAVDRALLAAKAAGRNRVCKPDGTVTSNG